MQDYLEQGEQDRQDLINNLETKGITGLTGDETFTELVPQVLNIPSGGNIDEYFETQPSTITTPTQWLAEHYTKNGPDVYIPNTTTSLERFGQAFGYMPRLHFGSNITNLFYFGGEYNGTVKINEELDTTYWDTSNVTSMMYTFCRFLNVKNLIGFSNLNTRSVTTFQNAFTFFGSNLTDNYPTLDISGWSAESATTLQSMFASSKIAKINASGFSETPCTNFNSMFSNVTGLTEVDLSNLVGTATAYTTSNMFQSSTSLQKIDMRSFDFTKISTYTNMFGSTLSNFPTGCLIIVADDTQKNWVKGKFSRLTNVKTVAEYEESLNQ